MHQVYARRPCAVRMIAITSMAVYYLLGENVSAALDLESSRLSRQARFRAFESGEL